MNEHVIQERRRGIDFPRLTVGLFLVTIGLAFLLDRLYWWDTHELVRLWPLWLIGFGVLRVAYPGDGRSRLGGFWPILIGSIFLMDALDLMRVNDSWPLFIVGGGILMMLRASGVGRCGHRQTGSERSGS